MVPVRAGDSLDDLCRILQILFAAFLFFPWFTSAPFAADYSQLRATAIKNCEANDPDDHQSGLLFNPDGFRSYYVRSECFQRTAVKFRDETLCRQVIRRYSLFSSSWGYSQGNCRKLVAEGIASDRNALEKVKREYRLNPVRLRDFRIERNGNGRDIDIIPSFTGGFGRGYTLRFEILRSGAGIEPIVLHSSGYYVDGSGNLRIFLRQDDIRKRFADFKLNRPYSLQATIILDIGNGGPAGFWSDTFIEQVFPHRDRSQSLIKEVRF
jgi:hypothetical protein